MNVPSRQLLTAVSILLLTALPARAQGHPDVVFGAANIDFMSAPVAFDSEVVTGTPFSAEAVTEVVQTLADGNRIVRENKARISRDGKGRVRREQGLAMFGPVIGGMPGGHEPRHVHISDPESKTTIMLDLQSKTAHRIPAPQFRLMNHAKDGAVERGGVLTGGKHVTVDHFEMALPAPPPGDPAAGVRVFNSHTVMAGKLGAEPVVEQLGSRFIEGVTADGTRTTLTIPAGQIGNESPINVVSERWYSPELKQLVMSLQSDPRFGVTTYRLTDITRGEPAPELFEVPADFKVMDPTKFREMIIERKMLNK
jgi:hypothetical protein